MKDRAESRGWSKRLLRWRRRWLSGNLGFGNELWMPIPSNDPRYAAIARIFGGRDIDPAHGPASRTRPSGYVGEVSEPRVRQELTQTLLEDVIAAAGGVEHSFDRMCDALTAVQDDADRWPRSFPEPPAIVEWSASAELTHAYYAYAEMLGWARTLEERVLAKNPVRRKVDGEAIEWRQGLIAALVPGELQEAIVRSFEQLQRGKLSEVRNLANYSLHVGTVPAHGSPRARIVEGRLKMRVPDPTEDRIEVWQELTFRDGRDAVTWGQQLLDEVDAFMEALLVAFESAPNRSRFDTPNEGRAE